MNEQTLDQVFHNVPINIDLLFVFALADNRLEAFHTVEAQLA
jgi:hypothetical protein